MLKTFLKTFAIVLCLAFVSAFAAPTPFNRETHERFQDLEAADLNGEVVLKFVADFSENEGVSGESFELSGNSSALGSITAIPAGFLVTSVYTYIREDVVSPSSNTSRVSCQSAGDLHATNDFSDDTVGTVVVGAVSSPSGAFEVNTACTPYIDTFNGSSGITAGELVIIIKGIYQELQTSLY